MAAPRTYVYVDGFNLYYGKLKGTRSKWLDVSALVSRVLPAFDIRQIRYFTAAVSPRPGNPSVHLRQQAYLSALGTLPNFSIHLGRFLQSTPMMPLLTPPRTGPKYVRVIKTEEKGSDVALASYMVADGFRQRYDVAIVVSNDSDLVPPIEIVTKDLGLTVGILNPQKNSSHALQKTATFYRPLRAGAIAASQFPDNVVAADGRVFSRPIEWR